MKAKLFSTQETYSIEEIPESKLIPQGTTFVNIIYDSRGNVTTVFYNSSKYGRKDFAKMQEELDVMNSRTLTQEEKNEVVGLLKKLSSE